ncbi:MAG: hypothetical protein CMI64_06950 [Pedosphaera sp.]|nr:hypothetical protein [Pedosphaera sp.]
MTTAGDILTSRGAKKFVHFHTDHWEPFAGDWDRWGDDSEENAEAILKFMEETAENPFFDRMTLFYNHPLKTTTLSEISPETGDLLRFDLQRPFGWERYAYAIGKCASETNHEFQVHIHHEGVTSGDFFKFSHLDWPGGCSSHELDSSRLERMIEKTLSDFREITNLNLLNWHFIHGLWALNASDTSVCNVADEIEMLMKHGCVGDFTMPAGRGIVDSKIKYPHTVLVTNKPKGYDLPESEPRRIGEDQGEEPRFLIWNQDVPFTHCSIDHYGSDEIRGALEDIEGTNKIWAEGAPIIGDVAFLKTHAHSMNRIYWKEDAERTYSSPLVLEIFQSMKNSCDDANIPYEKWTVSEVVEYLESQDQTLSKVLAREPPINVKIETIDQNIMHVCRQRLSRLGVEESGLFDYYAYRLEKGSIFSKSDLEILRHISNNYSKEARILEIAAGCGQISFGLEELGYKHTEYCEVNKKRIALGQEIKEKLNSQTNIITTDFRDLNLTHYDLIFVTNAVTDRLGVGEYEIFRSTILSGSQVILLYGSYGHDNAIFEKLDNDSDISHLDLISDNIAELVPDRRGLIEYSMKT